MRTIKKEIEVPVCEICGKEIIKNHTMVKDDEVYSVNEQFYFHRGCVDDALIKLANKFKTKQ